MFELYKERDLSANISDTVTFFKSFGKHFFKNFFIINGIFLMILMILIYFISKIYMEVLFSGANNLNNNPNYFSNYISENITLVVGGFLTAIIVIAILSMLNITFPIVYLKLFEKENNTNFSTQDISKELKKNIGKMFVFLLGITCIIMPLAFIVFGILVVLCFILIGFPLFIIIGIAFFSWVMLSYHDYILNDVGFFKALSNGYYLLKLKFWTIVGTTFLMLMLIQIIQGIITIIPYLFTIGSMLVSTQDGSSQTDNYSTFGIVMAVIMVLSVLISYIFNNFIVINQGLIYYSLHEDTENFTTNNQIDLIGTEIE
ncbi:hypothetical protein [Flavobacterium sp. IMCC34518]|uniref:hypothetical protein n=1 Tax=Flavobacterium sp. IMCC34518 TaxID=3003623 RepID=UPI0024822F31|nr:hypothetical protein [Flavobacterium sp. IMCC34518]